MSIAPTSPLSPDEIELVTLFRTLSLEKRRALLTLLAEIAARDGGK